MTIKTDQTDTLAARLEFASILARNVGLEALRYWNEQGADGLGTETKGLQDFVTKADKAAEHTIRSELARRFPQDGFIGEETGGTTGTGGYWVVDPIDGTANYLRGLRHWGVSIAYVSGGQMQLGLVHDSPTDRLYHAQAGQGAFRDGQPISVSPTSDPHAALGILGASRRLPVEGYLRQIKSLYDAGIEHRKIGSAAIGIIRVAEGTVDFYYEGHLNSWDALAAVLITREAGGTIRLPEMDKFIARGGEVFCATPALSDLLAGILAAK
ncbi:inositol monophosphatase family protein [Candidatus Halocynthiibacter alkanivorans]|uniref:inositol monophosphatase family protein n=1 Tax=Candidatus Halocynthiibacter alkanivorans TaxID=2267619 RepID=UPI000DF1E22A|nr:inositol monophosphatase [Candidatus Halocynthiibacter alkanivorans]